jgi:hypothetical protein
MKSVLLALGLLWIPSVGAQMTWHVPGHFPTLGDALAGAQTSDTILVFPGMYYESGLTFAGKALTLRATGGAAVTIIDAQNAGRILELSQNEGPGTRIEGFTFRNGQTLTSWGSRAGAVLCVGSSPTFVACRFESNRSGSGAINAGGDGGAVDAREGHLTLEDCVFADNRAGNNAIGGYGGALAADLMVLDIRRCAFLRNETGQGLCANYEGGSSGGGGACSLLRSQARFEDCLFRENKGADGVPCSDLGGSGGSGGAIMARTQTVLWIDRCRFISNSGGRGGSGVVDTGFGGEGGAILAETAFIASSLFEDNRTGSGLGGWNWGGAAVLDDAWITGCTFTKNVSPDHPVIASYLIPQSSIPRIFIQNSVLWENVGFNLTSAPVFSVRHSTVGGGASGVGNLSSDPLFADPAAGNYRLQAGSPAVGTADGSHVLIGELDVDGTPRIQGPGLDRGCYERPCLSGTGDPFVVRAFVDDGPATTPCDVMVLPASTVTVDMRGTDDLFAGSAVFVGVDAFPTGAPPLPSPIPWLHLDLTSVSVGQFLLPEGGIRFALLHGPAVSLTGMTLRVQALLLDPAAVNGTYVLSPAVDLTFL